ncbi:hypothetical protein [Piscinibacter gummiphilus]|uniref:DUF2486 family protein n=1 Tax=Piscinibacter gummiphilus TaxID=946333 RepID=A0ABZ0D0I5_9BURK|nr:hypothetical protein [Piscinibacter gummiphilus]WOB10750.1 hypothetical protein RXV79_12000 [Piscinibacter gummiphilus]
MKPNAPPPQPPQRVPVLTEVVVLPKTQPVVEDDEFPPLPLDPAFAATAPTPLGRPERAAVVPAAAVAPAPAPLPTPSAPAAVVDEARVVQRVLADLDKQLDLMFEHRLRESLSPVLARMTDSLVREMRAQLAANLREMVARAVSLELDRLQKR